MNKHAKCHTGPNCRLHRTNDITSEIQKEIETLRQEEQTKQDSLFNPSKERGETNTNQNQYAHLYLKSREIQETADKEAYYSIERYKINSYRYINAYNRYGMEGLEEALTKDGWRTIDKDTIKIVIDENRDIEALMQHKIEIDRPLYRTISFDSREELENLTPLQYARQKFQPGTIIEEKTYSSTTADPDFVTANTRHAKKGKQHIVFEIIPTQGLPVFEKNTLTDCPPGEEHILQGRYKQLQDFEREVILDKNSRFQIVNVKNITYKNSYSPIYTNNVSVMNDIRREAKYATVQMIQL